MILNPFKKLRVREYFISDPWVEITFVNNEGEAVGFFVHFSNGPDHMAMNGLRFEASSTLREAVYDIFREGCK
jgi:hypothetical protein